MTATEPPPPVLSHLPAAVLLAATGGLLDAIVYLNHGGVFANAMTGNTIFLGIALVERNWFQALRHVSPICAFLCGVLAARRVQYLPRQRTAIAVLLLEILSLFALGLLPHSFPELLFTAILSFVSAFQVTTFRRVGRFTYNSTFVTGNLREVGEGLFDSLFADDPAVRYTSRRKFLKLTAICFSFFLGAVGGALAAHDAPRHALWFAEPLLLSVLMLTVLRPVATR